jgi:hypothetical protein
MAKSKKGRGGKKRAKQQFKRLGAPKRGGKKATAQKKIRTLALSANVDVWKAQNALRKDGFFARAVGPHAVATNAPSATI